MSTTNLLQQVFLCLAVMTSMGTLVHDTKLNKALEASVPLSTISTNLSSHLDSLNEASSHTHVERASLSQAFSGIPSVQPRGDHRKYMMVKTPGRNSDSFGGSRILWPSV